MPLQIKKEWFSMLRMLEVEEKNDFKVTDIKSADYCMKRIKIAQEKKAEIEQYVKEEKANLDNYLKENTEEFNNEIELYTEFLKGYYLEKLKEDKKFKLKTPNGELKTRKSKKGFDYEDEKMMEFLKENNPELVEHKLIEKFNKNEVKKHIEERDFIDEDTGEIFTKIVLDGKIVEFVTEKEITVNYEVKVK